MAFDSSESSWFLAQLKPNCANIADKNLKRQGFKTFLPQQEDTRQRDGKFITALRPLFRATSSWPSTQPAVFGVRSTQLMVSHGWWAWHGAIAVPLDLIGQLRLRAKAANCCRQSF
jgi:transcriptional antiterminator RfaH